jgi:hypothetical protein
MLRKLFVSLALLTAMSVLSQSSAQQFDPEMLKIIRPVQKILQENPAVLAGNSGVQKELKMDEDQIKAVREKGIGGFGGGFGKGKDGGGDQKERFAKMMEKYGQLKDVPEDKLEAKIREVFKEEIEGPAKEVEKILKPEQMARLKQIGRQQGGAAAYVRADNAKDLSLTDEQKAKLKEIVTELEKDIGELTRSGGKGGFNLSAETREKITALNKEAKEKAEALLTSEQKSKWKEVVGEPYTVTRDRPMRPKKDD